MKFNSVLSLSVFCAEPKQQYCAKPQLFGVHCSRFFCLEAASCIGCCRWDVAQACRNMAASEVPNAEPAGDDPNADIKAAGYAHDIHTHPKTDTFPARKPDGSGRTYEYGSSGFGGPMILHNHMRANPPKGPPKQYQKLSRRDKALKQILELIKDPRPRVPSTQLGKDAVNVLKAAKADRLSLTQLLQREHVNTNGRYTCRHRALCV